VLLLLFVPVLPLLRIQAYQTFLHYRRLRAWQAAHPEEAAQEQQARQQQQAPQLEQADRKWGGLMGFGPQELPEGCSGAVKEVGQQLLVTS
jgi:hypothetical protein